MSIVRLAETHALNPVYISGRPFVFRDAAEPRRTLNISDRAENLEAIETRLKNDILQEAARLGNSNACILVDNHFGQIWRCSSNA